MRTKRRTRSKRHETRPVLQVSGLKTSQLKASCVPLLGNSLLTPASVPKVSDLLAELLKSLHEIEESEYPLNASLISYIFFPISTILRRNESMSIPDRVLESMLAILSILCEFWWWDIDLSIWDQLFMLCGAIVSGNDGRHEGKNRSEETKDAAVQCLQSLLRARTPLEGEERSANFAVRLAQLQDHTRAPTFISVLGQTLNSLLSTAESRHLPLQKHSLQLLNILIRLYIPEDLAPTVVPGVVSTMCKLALDSRVGKGWAKGEIVDEALQVMQEVIIRSIGDKICIKEGAVRDVESIEDLAEVKGSAPDELPRHSYTINRTSAWLQGTSSQLHIALNSLTPLVMHPNHLALLALSRLSYVILSQTLITLPQSQGLLLSFLLSLSNSQFSSVSIFARNQLLQLITPEPRGQQSLLKVLMHIAKDNLLSVSRLLSSQADAKVEHAAGLVESICRLCSPDDDESMQDLAALAQIARGIGKLLGPSGGIEKWGWTLLSVLEFANSPIAHSTTSAAQLMLENDPDVVQYIEFPELTFKNIGSRSTQAAFTRMLRLLGKVAGETCFFSIEWFVSVSRTGTDSRAVAGLWCACRLLEGIGEVALDKPHVEVTSTVCVSRRVEQLSRALAKEVAEMWDNSSDISSTFCPIPEPTEDDNSPVELSSGLIPVRAPVGSFEFFHSQKNSTRQQPSLHCILRLHILSITAGILQARFTPLLIHALYPVLHSIVSPESQLSSTAFATLSFITISTSYATPRNLLFSNFDYALDSISRRMTRRWLDIDATKVLSILVRLVGTDIVQIAGDVVEVCFDRLDDFHGYEIIVEGVIQVLGEVVNVVEKEEEASRGDPIADIVQRPDIERLNIFSQWYNQRRLESHTGSEAEDYGPAPREAWGEQKGKDSTNNPNDENQLLGEPDANSDPPQTPTHALTQQIVARCMYFLTHGSPGIRSRVLTLLCASVPALPESALLPSIHLAWPFILNRLDDPEPFVVRAAACLVESLAKHVGQFMFRKIWDDVWPKFQLWLTKLDAADSSSALTRRGFSSVGTESAYTHSHRLYRAVIKTMTAAMKGVQIQDSSVWKVIVAFRRFLLENAHEELQQCARELFVAIGKTNEDAVWLALSATSGQVGATASFMRESQWDIQRNVSAIFNELGDI